MKKVFLLAGLFLFVVMETVNAQGAVLLRYKYRCSGIPQNAWYSDHVPCTPKCLGDQTLMFEVVFNIPPPGGTIGTNPYRMKVELFDANSTIIGSNQIDYSIPAFSPTFFISNVIAGPIKAKVLLQKRNITGWTAGTTYWTNTLIKDACAPACIPTITITGNYTTALTQSLAWIKTNSFTVIPSGNTVKLDANNPFNTGFIELNPGFETQAGVIFIAQALDGCGVLVPMPTPIRSPAQMPQP